MTAMQGNSDTALGVWVWGVEYAGTLTQCRAEQSLLQASQPFICSR